MMVFSLVFGLLCLILPVAVIVMVTSAIIKNRNAGNKQDNFEKNIRAIYVYLILICSLFMVIGGVIYLFNSAMDYFLPEESTGSSSVYRETERNEAIVNIYTACSLLVVSVPLFVYHSKIAKEEGNKPAQKVEAN